jgi:dimethylaniline monooxygenase (N-oxide forming)
MHTMALLFSREANVEPDFTALPQLPRALLFGPLSAISFRLSGPDRLKDEGERVAAEAREAGVVVSPRFSSEEVARLQALARARKNLQFAKFVDRISNP